MLVATSGVVLRVGAPHAFIHASLGVNGEIAVTMTHGTKVIAGMTFGALHDPFDIR